MEDLISVLTDDEGVKLQVYDDATGGFITPHSTVKGHPTIGIGRCLDRQGITLDEARMLLANDVNRIKSQLEQQSWYVSLDPARQLVMCCMAFQLGVGATLSFRTMIARIKMQQWEAAAFEMVSSLWATQTPKRVQRLAQIMRTGELPS